MEVEQWPAEVIAGKDPQLEKAIQIVLEELAEKPAQAAATPALPGEGEAVGGAASDRAAWHACLSSPPALCLMARGYGPSRSSACSAGFSPSGHTG